MTGGTGAGTFAELLRRHRVNAGLSQHELTLRSGLSERALRDLERGRRQPRSHSVRLLADALSLTGEDRGVFLAATRADAVNATTVAAPVDELIGRHDELAALLDLVAGARHRLITVTGPAGVGKSRIAAELAALLARRTDVAVRTLDLSAVCEPELVGELIAGALGCGPSRLAPVDRIAAYLGDQRVVLVVDRFEHLVDTAAELADLVRRCPGLTLVVTTQRRLQLRDERVLTVPPLSPEAATTLFVRRAEAASPGFAPDEQDISVINAICARLDSLPLAIELAAARIRLMRPAELAERLDRRLQVLSDGARDLPPRHRSLRGAIESSLEVVGPRARAAFRWFGAFADGGRLTDIEAVATLLGDGGLIESLTELVDINLVRVAVEGSTSRYTLPDTAAELAAEQLAGDDDRDRIARAVATHFLGRVRHGYAGSGPAADDRDAANVRAAVLWAIEHEPAFFDTATTVALGRFYETTGRLLEGQTMLTRVAATGPPGGWVRAGHLAALRGDLPAAVDLGNRGLSAAAVTDHMTHISALSLLAQTAVEQGDPRIGRTHLRVALIHARRAGDDALLGRVLNNLASVSMETGRPQDAERQMRAALEAKRRAGAGPVDVGRTLFNLADIGLDVGDHDMVVARAREAVPLLLSGGFPRLAAAAEAAAALATLYRDGPAAAMVVVARATGLLASDDSEDRRTEALVRLRCSVVQHAAGETTTAWRALRDALPVALEHTSRDRDALADVLQSHAPYLVRHDADVAVTLLGAGERLRRRHVPAPITDIRDRTAAIARDRVGDSRFTTVFDAGAALDDDGLIALIARHSPS